MTALGEATTRWFIKRCNGAEPGEVLDEAHARIELQRVANQGIGITGSLAGGAASWRHASGDRTFSLSEIAETDLKRRQRGWGGQ